MQIYFMKFTPNKNYFWIPVLCVVWIAYVIYAYYFAGTEDSFAFNDVIWTSLLALSLYFVIPKKVEINSDNLSYSYFFIKASLKREEINRIIYSPLHLVIVKTNGIKVKLTTLTSTKSIFEDFKQQNYAVIGQGVKTKSDRMYSRGVIIMVFALIFSFLGAGLFFYGQALQIPSYAIFILVAAGGIMLPYGAILSMVYGNKRTEEHAKEKIKQ
jgi:hypothetical protein